MLGASDAWSMSHLSRQTSKPAYYIVDCRILAQAQGIIIRHHPIGWLSIVTIPEAAFPAFA